MTMTVLRCPATGKLACVPTGEEITNYDGWTVLCQQEGLPPEHATWVDGTGWVVDEQAAADAAEAARLNTLTRAEYMAEIDTKLAQLGTNPPA